MSSYTIHQNIVADTRLRKQLESSNIAILLGVFNKTIIPLALVGYGIVITNSALRASLAIYHPRGGGGGGGGGTRGIHDGESDGASYCKPKKIHTSY